MYSIGHSNHDPARFLELLKAYKIRILVDTRSVPASRAATEFNRNKIERWLSKARIRYVYLGDELGGRPKEREFYDDDGHVLYAKLAESKPFLEGIEFIANSDAGPTVLMCSEENPSYCHRRLLIGRHLKTLGIDVLHIRADGKIETEQDLPNPELKTPTPKNQSLLYAPREGVARRSIPSVLPRRPRGNSSKRLDEPEFAE